MLALIAMAAACSCPESSRPAVPTGYRTASSSPIAGLTTAEQDFVNVLRGGRWDDDRMKSAAAEFDRAMRDAGDPRESGLMHYGVYAQWARERMTRNPQTAIDPWDQAMLDYLQSRPDPAEALILLAAVRNGRLKHFEVGQLYVQWSVGLFSRKRGEHLMSLVRSRMNVSDLKGATVADIGSGPGHFARILLDLVGTKGKVLPIDVDPSVLGIQPFLARLDPDFARLDFRIVRVTVPACGLRPTDAVSAAFLMDVHLLGLQSPDLSTAWQVQWLDNVYSGLKKLGSLVTFEGGQPGLTPSSALRVIRMSRFGSKGCSVRMQWVGKEGYFIVARKAAM